VLRSLVAAVLLASSLSLAAVPALAVEDGDATEWWARVTTENAPAKFHLLPDDSEQPRDWLGLLRDTGFIIGYQVVGAAILYVVPPSV
jgi:predicted lysophospholipase L1 biosynthesis ABC-type transport system permease subunit